MEIDIKDIHTLKSVSKKGIQVLEKLDTVIDDAEEIRERKDVENPELIKSLEIVKDFLIKTKRICYGGMAINAQLPKEKQFYDFSRELPDYDFFSPTPNKDVDELISMLKKSGFKDVSIRLAVNPGTTKVSVNYNSIADITYMPLWVFTEISKKSFVDNDGVYYADADFLRMKMYLELSRPLGEVERWKKVYQRLLLLSQNQPLNSSTCSSVKIQSIPKNVHEALLDYTMKHELIFLGAEIQNIYEDPSVFHKEILDNSVYPVLVLSPNPEKDAKSVKKELEEFYTKDELHLLSLRQEGEYIPGLFGVVHKKTILFLAIQEHMCHSYNPVPYKNKSLFISSLDNAIYIFYLLSHLHELEGVLPYTFECFAKQLVKISNETRDKDNSGIFPLFPITCRGYQASIQSLLRYKEKRVKAYKAAQKIRKLRKTLRTNRNNKTNKSNKNNKNNKTNKST
jgi:hypothetical protein